MDLDMDTGWDGTWSLSILHGREGGFLAAYSEDVKTLVTGGCLVV